jgi:hypothetical protein
MSFTGSKTQNHRQVIAHREEGNRLSLEDASDNLASVNLASLFNLGGPDVIILLFVLIVLVGVPAIVIYWIVAIFKGRSQQKPPPIPPSPPPPPPQSDL